MMCAREVTPSLTKSLPGRTIGAPIKFWHAFGVTGGQAMARRQRLSQARVAT